MKFSSKYYTFIYYHIFLTVLIFFSYFNSFNCHLIRFTGEKSNITDIMSSDYNSTTLNNETQFSSQNNSKKEVNNKEEKTAENKNANQKSSNLKEENSINKSKSKKEEINGFLKDKSSNLSNNEENEDVGEIPTDKSDVTYDAKQSKLSDYLSAKNIKNKDTIDDVDEETLALYAFYIILVFLSVFLFLFIYNLLKCYYKNPRERESRTELQTYSRELGNMNINDDTVLDLSH